MNIKRATALALSLSLLLGAAACGKSDSEAADTGSKTSAELLEEENAILDAHQELWNQVFASMDKSSPATAENYGDVLLSALENCRDKLSDEDYQTLKSDAESIRSIEEQIAALPADDSAGQSETAAASAFPEFTGKDLDGNAVDSSLFANNAYTVVNFWFSGCKPCVAELGELDKLNQTAKQQGGEVIGINTETLDGSADAIATAKEILQTKGAQYIKGKTVRSFAMPMTHDRAARDASHDAAADAICALIGEGKTVAFLTLGDPTVYSTAWYVHKRVAARGCEAELVPGVPSFCAAAARLGRALCEDGEMLHIIPASHGREREGLALPGSKVLMKAGRGVLRVRDELRESGQLEQAALVERCGMEGERVVYDLDELDEPSGYFSIILVKEERK